MFKVDPVVRYCEVPRDLYIFFPVANAFCSAEGTFQEMRRCAIQLMRSATNLRAEIDGVAVQDLADYRALSPNFALVLPRPNIFRVPAGTYEPSAADGVYLLLNPLSPGEHTIRFSASFPDDEVDVTYHLLIP